MSGATPLALWIGPETTVHRIGDVYGDQLERTGFAARLDDLDRLASTGASRVRFPLLWERVERAPGMYDWAWSDERMARLRDSPMEPIVGLLHHGSGPRDTDLLDPAFPGRFAAFARAVGRRYPWVRAYTPINEPLTTARFSALYGLWHPGQASDTAFVKALLNQIRAIALAMRELKCVNAESELIQTEDLGRCASSARLRYQAAFENERRWLTFDLLNGRVDDRHPLRRYMELHGAPPSLLDALLRDTTPPDILGVNVYVTSERFLDHRAERHPAQAVGGNARDRYVDVEAVRVLGSHVGSFGARLRETANRYPTPLAITEAHLGCSREEQMRWLHEAWRAAESLRRKGLDVRAVTAWAAFGAFDWDSLLTKPQGHYESGLWDVRAPRPRSTGLLRLASELAAGARPTHPVLEGPGWWRRDIRLLYSPIGAVRARRPAGRPLLVAGGGGTLGRALARICALRGLPCRLTTRQELDIGSSHAVRSALQRWQPWAVINAAGYVRIDAAQSDPRQWHDNAVGPVVLAQACGNAGLPLLHFSSALVFDGACARPYRESDVAHALSQYGVAKLRADRALRERRGVLVVRSGAFFGPWDTLNFVTRGLASLARGESWLATRHQILSPTYLPQLVDAALDLLIDGEHGLWHVANRGAVSWYRFACMAAEASSLPVRLVRPCAPTQAAPRPPYSALGSEKAQLMPRLDDAIGRYVREVGLWNT